MHEGVMRDRLIELIGEYHAHPERFCPRMDTDQPCSGCKYDLGFECNQDGKLADHLLDNGVIVPPCKVGSEVYYADHENKSALYGNLVSYSLDAAHLWFNCHYKCGLNMWHPIEDFGKTVFLTREEAEKALAESEGKG